MKVACLIALCISFAAAAQPEFCSLQLVSGFCKAYMPSYGYDANLRLCRRFIYGGCGGNKNRFSTEAECMKTCSPVTGRPTFAAATTVVAPSIPQCEQPPLSGDCEAYIPSFAFDTPSGQCIQFIYGGCGGNGNRFRTETECMKACSTSAVASPTMVPVTRPKPTAFASITKRPSICNEPMERGFCKARILSYGFDTNMGACVKFYYGGCGGTANRFNTLADCEKTCN